MVQLACPAYVGPDVCALPPFADDDGEDEEECSRYPSLLVGPSLRAARLHADKRQGEVARYLGLDSSIPPRWEGHIGSTRYKPLPGKYIQPLATFFGCSIFDIAPQLHEYLPPEPATSAQTGDEPEPQSILATRSLGSSASSMSIYVSMGSSGPSPAPGVPPAYLRAVHSWRRICRHCGREYLETQALRAPLDCETCGHPLRARSMLKATQAKSTQRSEIAA